MLCRVNEVGVDQRVEERIVIDKVGNEASVPHGAEDPEKLVDKAGGGEGFDERIGGGESDGEVFEIVEGAAEGGGVVKKEGKE